VEEVVLRADHFRDLVVPEQLAAALGAIERDRDLGKCHSLSHELNSVPRVHPSAQNRYLQTIFVDQGSECLLRSIAGESL